MWSPPSRSSSSKWGNQQETSHEFKSFRESSTLQWGLDMQWRISEGKKNGCESEGVRKGFLKKWYLSWGLSVGGVGSVQSLSCVWLFATPWTAARQASLSFTVSWSLLKLMSIESMMLSRGVVYYENGPNSSPSLYPQLLLCNFVVLPTSLTICKSAMWLALDMGVLEDLPEQGSGNWLL